MQHVARACGQPQKCEQHPARACRLVGPACARRTFGVCRDHGVDPETCADLARALCHKRGDGAGGNGDDGDGGDEDGGDDGGDDGGED